MANEGLKVYNQAKHVIPPQKKRSLLLERAFRILSLYPEPRNERLLRSLHLLKGILLLSSSS